MLTLLVGSSEKQDEKKWTRDVVLMEKSCHRARYKPPVEDSADKRLQCIHSLLVLLQAPICLVTHCWSEDSKGNHADARTLLAGLGFCRCI